MTSPRLLGLAPWGAVVFVWLWLFPYSQQLNNPNERSRVLQAIAIVNDGTLAIGRVEHEPSPRGPPRWYSVDVHGQRHGYDPDRGHAFVNDVALVCDDPGATPPACPGTIYPAKPPGAALLGVPALALGSSLGLIPTGLAGEPHATWALRYGGVALPMLLALIAFAALLRAAGLPRPLTRRALLATALGTSLLPYTLTFVGHALAGAAIIGAAALLLRAIRASATLRALPTASAAGLVAGSAVLFEYHAALLVLPLGVFALATPARSRALPGFVLGGLVALLAHAALHDAMFGSALKTGHHFLMSAHNRVSQAGGFLGIEMFSFRALADHLFDPYMGLLPTMPWLAIGALVGFPAVFSRRATTIGGFPRGLGVALGIGVLLYLVFVSSLGKWQTMNGWGFGPRYLVPAIFPLAFIAALGWHRAVSGTPALPPAPALGRVIAALAAASVLVMVVNAAAVPSPHDGARNTFGELALPLVEAGFGARSPGVTLGLGPFALAPGLAVAALAALVVAFGRDGAAAPRRAHRMFGAALLALWLLAAGTHRPSPPVATADARAFSERITEGTRPDGRGLFIAPRTAPPPP
jgi:hypothetical protein